MRRPPWGPCAQLAWRARSVEAWPGDREPLATPLVLLGRSLRCGPLSVGALRRKTKASWTNIWPTLVSTSSTVFQIWSTRPIFTIIGHFFVELGGRRRTITPNKFLVLFVEKCSSHSLCWSFPPPGRILRRPALPAPASCRTRAREWNLAGSGWGEARFGTRSDVQR